jgi:hypothetical protein
MQMETAEIIRASQVRAMRKDWIDISDDAGYSLSTFLIPTHYTEDVSKVI